ncbi:GNAT family N-acetyltransferase [Agromyces protaetiae]|uniref:GNAT family N-acetyltransferase n=1 Tax=Agromyces protaetiae TaxID=2509455 RepID=A0A4P6FQW4_9MICO|nr:GNAT family N-acetyltransferase [Agromyces protaetiae]QAY72918.1 GNAT family N-acetyltransferase [Agromyces protaetiae]
MRAAEASVTVALESPRQPEVDEMLRGSEAYSYSLYPPEACFLLDVESLERPGVAFYVARGDVGEALGMGALVDGVDGTAELKRMFVHESARGRRVGTSIIERIEQDASARGIRRIVLETGTRHDAAQAMYAKAGYEVVPLFGQYVGEEFSVCMAKNLG